MSKYRIRRPGGGWQVIEIDSDSPLSKIEQEWLGYEEEVETTIDGLSSIIEPLMIVVMGALVGLIAASVMGPISSLSKNIGG